MFIAVPLGILGAIVGSFLNVVIFRYAEQSVTGRSACRSCKAQLSWFELIPVFSWLVLGARCRHCGARLSIQYPLVELGAAAAFAGIGFALADSATLSVLPLLIVRLLIVSFLICITVYDLRHTIIPDPWVYSFAGLALVHALLSFTLESNVALSLLGGPIAAAPLFALWFVSRGTWMGFGDVKLALGIGWLLGPVFGLVAIFLAFMIGGAVSVPLLALSSQEGKRILERITPTDASKKWRWEFTIKSEIPFGPFLVAACLIVWFSMMYGLRLPFLAIYGL